MKVEFQIKNGEIILAEKGDVIWSDIRAAILSNMPFDLTDDIKGTVTTAQGGYALIEVETPSGIFARNFQPFEPFGPWYRLTPETDRPKDLRDEFAAAALTGLLANGTTEPGVARIAYDIADEMIAERRKRK